MLTACPAAVNGAGTRLGAPFFACRWLESAIARSHSSWSAACSSASSLLEEIGSYAFATAHPQGTTTNAQALADDVPLQIDGACCYNTQPGGKTKP